MMLYPVIMFMATGLAGTVLALRLMALEAQDHGTRLTVRGRIVVGLAIGTLIAVFTLLVGGIWWDCDLTQPGSTCAVGWGY